MTLFGSTRLDSCQGETMNIAIRISFILLSPVFLFIYWRNSLRQIEDLHANFDLKYAD